MTPQGKTSTSPGSETIIELLFKAEGPIDYQRLWTNINNLGTVYAGTHRQRVLQ